MKLKIPPPILFIFFAILIYFLPPILSFPPPFYFIIILLCSAFLLGTASLRAFRIAKTVITPLKPNKTSKIVTSGVYRISRNPMYLSLALCLLAWGMYLGKVSSIFGVILFVLLTTYLQIKPEEQALEQKFGEAYRQYKQSIRRWL